MRTAETAPELLTISEVAGILRVSKVSVYRYITLGLLPSVRFGGTLRVRVDDLDVLLASRTDRETTE